ncbi:uncharacterized protein LOC120283303 [Dioscorea cayenensis subsp. rotundata]|uniref:Uncharacterized protein LOC120283303 n=1 Tax=Dioscorea cayennensis subsp. rotundata TaxID=55577 RepID=A0AB40D0L9_DIOCR|nr:uncharacterized protein LOC120283303 [Dioscorea cayenensis subsp. rotundata]
MGDLDEETEGVAVLDFDMLCATVALQTQGFSVERRKGSEEDDEMEESGEFGGVQRMWEGGVLDFFEDRRIAIESACCPCYRFGKNMRRANLGPCFLQAAIYFLLVVAVVFNIISFVVTRQHLFLYLEVVFIILFGVYVGYFRSRIRRQFNIKGSDTYIDDCVNHLICPCGSLCQESRTLEMNNILDGVWHGRGETICLGTSGEGSKAFAALYKPSLISTKSPVLCSMEKPSDTGDHSWIIDVSPSKPLVLLAEPAGKAEV